MKHSTEVVTDTGARPHADYAERTLSGIAAPQASVSSRKADCQLLVTMSCAVQELSSIQKSPGEIGVIQCRFEEVCTFQTGA